MEQQITGSFKPSTIKKFVDFMKVLQAYKSFDIRRECDLHGITMGFPAWLIKQGIIRKVEDNLFEFTGTYGLSSVNVIEGIINEFSVYSKATRLQYLQDKSDLEYYRANKEFLVDSRKLTTSVSSIDNLPKELKYQIATLAAEYADLALKSGKKDIKGFVYHLFTLD